MDVVEIVFEKFLSVLASDHSSVQGFDVATETRYLVCLLRYVHLIFNFNQNDKVKLR